MATSAAALWGAPLAMAMKLVLPTVPVSNTKERVEAGSWPLSTSLWGSP